MLLEKMISEAVKTAGITLIVMIAWDLMRSWWFAHYTAKKTKEMIEMKVKQ